MASKNFFEQIGITPVQAVGVVAGLASIYAVGRKFGIIKGEEQVKENKLLGEKMFEPNYLQTLPPEQKVLKFSSASTVPDIAEKIWKAKGFFKDDMAQLWGAIKRMKYKTQVAQVNTFFNQKYSKEMFTYMQTFLNAEEMAQIFDYLNKLPSGLM